MADRNLPESMVDNQDLWDTSKMGKQGITGSKAMDIIWLISSTSIGQTQKMNQ